MEAEVVGIPRVSNLQTGDRGKCLAWRRVIYCFFLVGFQNVSAVSMVRYTGGIHVLAN